MTSALSSSSSTNIVKKTAHSFRTRWLIARYIHAGMKSTTNTPSSTSCTSAPVQIWFSLCVLGSFAAVIR